MNQKEILQTVSKTAIIVSVLLAVVIIILLTLGWYKLYREEEQGEFSTPEELFKYGSIGSETSQGIPYWIWLVMPKMFPEHLPALGGWASLGLPWEQGKELPVGFSKKTIGFPRVAFNCAFCHAARYRLEPTDVPTIVVPGPSHTVHAQGYARFLAAAANDARFNSDEILSQIDRIYKLSWLDKLLYRFIIIPQTKKSLIQYGERFAWAEQKPDWGPGRIDPFNPIKFGVLQMSIDETIGNSDMPPIWNMKARANHALHWDGLNTNFHEVVVSSAIGDGTTYESYPEKNMKKIEQWLQEVPTPKSPFSSELSSDSSFYLNTDLAEHGKTIFNQHCASCHAPDGEKTGKIIPVTELGTDRHRVDMWTAEAAKRYNTYEKNHDWGMRNFQDVDGYVAVLLDGIWLRGPYLHNGSVPTLKDLLRKAEDRPEKFFRGYDLIDPKNIGFVSSGAMAEKVGVLYDTKVSGNSNVGHNYGTDLPEDQKEALLEYLKTL
ncbi:MAG TPA: cytochrome c [Nitrosomonas sp.]|nr:cytochrome c [Nitrosomonas sp.]HQX13490.1 cytochrome c [Nitrosomonas sp.]HRB31944.1 cytochrome c [Nitrosomonas sp.]HRB44777.1 cytochrome c [Nitrosomonas sp.]HRB76878.1 cytochrome c [Nitrosomonas sp.]